MYDNIVETLMLECGWDTTNFLVVSKNVFDPFIYYSHSLPLLVSLTIGFFVLYKNPKQLLARILFTITTLFSLWVFFDLILWATDKPDYTIFFWSIVNLIEPLIYAASLYFIQVFIKNRDTSLKSKMLVLAPLVPFILLGSTKFALLGYDLTNCNREAIEGPLTHFSYIVEIFYTLWIVLFAMESYRRVKERVVRLQIITITIGIILFLLTFSFGNIVGSITDDWRIPQWGIFGMPIFIAFLSYLIVKYRTFDIKLIATQALAVAISILVGSQFFFIDAFGNLILNGVTLFTSVVGGILLVRSVRFEIEAKERERDQRQRIEHLAENLKSANESLQQLNKQKTEFVSFASHQLRGPLTPIKGYAESILEGDFGKISEDVRKAAQIIFDSTTTLAQVVDDYLNVTRIELGKLKFDFVEFNFKDTVQMVVDQMRPSIEKKGLKFNVEIDPGFNYQLRGDKEKLNNQVIANLIDNSFKYTSSGEIRVSLSEVGEKIRFSVKDTGVGISKETISQLFSKFKRATNANKANIHGTGLGLFIAKEIVNAHKGKIWAESDGEGRGSEFIVELPKNNI
ncbi:MAG TPA: ATP-binding protein [Candidatus Nanoarchaeia archaeon]|nr:ATP-binding protein [Candidatus Nanoarchaeia archaeon]